MLKVKTIEKIIEENKVSCSSMSMYRIFKQLIKCISKVDGWEKQHPLYTHAINNISTSNIKGFLYKSIKQLQTHYSDSQIKIMFKNANKNDIIYDIILENKFIDILTMREVKAIIYEDSFPHYYIKDVHIRQSFKPYIKEREQKHIFNKSGEKIKIYECFKNQRMNMKVVNKLANEIIKRYIISEKSLCLHTLTELAKVIEPKTIYNDITMQVANQEYLQLKNTIEKLDSDREKLTVYKKFAYIIMTSHTRKWDLIPPYVYVDIMKNHLYTFRKYKELVYKEASKEKNIQCPKIKKILKPYKKANI